MTDDVHRTSTDARLETHRQREKRSDAVVEMPFGERVDVECPACEESFLNHIAGAPATSPSFGSCPNWDCDAFLKFRSDGSETTESDERATQTALEQFGGGASA